MGLTVREHLVLAYRARVSPARLWRDMFDPALAPPTVESGGRAVDGLLELLRLTRVAKAPVAALPLGVLRLVEVGPGAGQRPPGAPARRAALGTRRARRRRTCSASSAQIVDQAERPAVDHHRRARRGRRARPLGHGLRARLRRAHRGGHARGDPQRPGRPRRLPRRQRAPDTHRAGRRGPGGPGARAERARPRHPAEPRADPRGPGPRRALRDARRPCSASPSTSSAGTVLAVLGANGAGKSTLARAVSGLVPPTGGRVAFDGQDITGLAGAQDPLDGD